jgi:hypothetical protein
VSYCSVECQHSNWKDHKITCGKKLLSEDELEDFVTDIKRKSSSLDLEDREGRNISYYRGTLLLAEYQFGDQYPGECYRRRKNGDTFRDDWILFKLRELLVESYIRQSTVAALDSALIYATETRTQLEMRRSNEDDQQICLHFIYRINTQMGNILRKTMRYEQSLYHTQEALAAVRLIEYDDENKLQSMNLFFALKDIAYTSGLLKNDGTKYAEEAYNFVSSQYGPEHPDVQDSASCLIDSYLQMGKFVDAERFARITNECLLDPSNNTDCKSKLFAYAKMQLARIWMLTPADKRIRGSEGAEEAETLLREASDILEVIERGEGFDDPITCALSSALEILAELMMTRGKEFSEVESTLLRALSLSKECRAGAVPRVESSSNRYRLLQLLGQLYLDSAVVTEDADVGLIEKSKCAYEESMIIATAIFSPDDGRLSDGISKLRMLDVISSICA